MASEFDIYASINIDGTKAERVLNHLTKRSKELGAKLNMLNVSGNVLTMKGTVGEFDPSIFKKLKGESKFIDEIQESSITAVPKFDIKQFEGAARKTASATAKTFDDQFKLEMAHQKYEDLMRRGREVSPSAVKKEIEYQTFVKGEDISEITPKKYEEAQLANRAFYTKRIVGEENKFMSAIERASKRGDLIDFDSWSKQTDVKARRVALDPETGEYDMGKYTAVVDESTKDFAELDKRYNTGLFNQQRWKGLQRGVKVTGDQFLSLNMAALGVYFSVLSVMMMMKQIGSMITAPLGDLGKMIKSVAMTSAFGADAMKDFVKSADTSKMVTSWKNFLGLQSSLDAVFAMFASDIFSDPALFETLSGAIKDLGEALTDPEMVTGIQGVFKAFATAIPAAVDVLTTFVNAFLFLNDTVFRGGLPSLILWTVVIGGVMFPLLAVANAFLQLVRLGTYLIASINQLILKYRQLTLASKLQDSNIKSLSATLATNTAIVNQNAVAHQHNAKSMASAAGSAKLYEKNITAAKKQNILFNKTGVDSGLKSLAAFTMLAAMYSQHTATTDSGNGITVMEDTGFDIGGAVMDAINIGFSAALIDNILGNKISTWLATKFAPQIMQIAGMLAPLGAKLSGIFASASLSMVTATGALTVLGAGFSVLTGIVLGSLGVWGLWKFGVINAIEDVGASHAEMVQNSLVKAKNLGANIVKFVQPSTDRTNFDFTEGLSVGTQIGGGGEAKARVISGVIAGADRAVFGTPKDEVLDKLGNIPMLAKGGIVNKPTVAMIGEAGAEAVIPLRQLDKYTGGGGDSRSTGTHTVDITPNFETLDVSRFEKVVSNEVSQTYANVVTSALPVQDRFDKVWVSIETGLTRLTSATGSQATKMFWSFANPMMMIPDVMGGVWNSVILGLQNVVSWFGELWEGVVGFVTEKLAPIIDFFGGIWDSIMDGSVLQWFGDLWGSITSWAVERLAPIFEFFGGLWESIMNGTVLEWFGSLWSSIVEKATELLAPVLEFFGGLWDTFMNSELVTWATDTFTGILDTVMSVLAPVFEFFGSIWDTLKDSTIVSWFSDTFDEILDTIRGIVDLIIAQIKRIPGVEAIAEGVSGFVGGVASAFGGGAEKSNDSPQSMNINSEIIIKSDPSFPIKTEMQTKAQMVSH